MRASLTVDDLWRALNAVPDPEIPVLSVRDLGIVRDVRITDDAVEVDVTPTYSGCPALDVIERDIVSALEAAGAERVRVRAVYQPAWTTDWLSAESREKLRASGIAPPAALAESSGAELIPLRRRLTHTCPFCGSTDTEERSEFGPTACKGIQYCRTCQQPFENFKSI